MGSDTESPIQSAAVQLRRARIFWRFALVSPVAYLLFSILLQQNGWLTPARRLDVTEFLHTGFGRWMLLVFLVLLALVAIVSFRRPRVATDPAGWRRRFYLSIACCDSLAFAGLAGWFLTGHAEVFLIGAVAAYLGYACAHPRANECLPAP